jgi:spermidine/putrescine transport system permease protein
MAATILIFIPTVGDYVTPILVGGPDGLMIGNMIQIHFGNVNNWPMGAALAISMMLVVAFIAASFVLLARRAMRQIA